MRDCLWNNVKKRVCDCDLEFSYVFIFKKCSLSRQSNIHHSGRSMIKWTPSVAISSNFKASGFTEAVMQMNFWISHDLDHLSTQSSSCDFCVCFWQAQAFHCISAASLTFDAAYFFWQGRLEIRQYLDYSIFFCANLYRNNHRITSILLSLGSIGLEKVEIWLLWFATVLRDWCITWLCGCESLILSHHLAKFEVYMPCESGNITSLIYYMTTWSMYHVTLWVEFLYPKSQPC